MIEVLERGDIFFLYRPRVTTSAGPPPEVRGLHDVQRLFVVLEPDGRDVLRRIVVGKKKLPELTGERHWGFVDRVTPRVDEVRADLEPSHYATLTRGERLQPGTRAAGEGVYALVRHDDHTHLVYALELPREPGEVQEQLAIAPEASYVIAVKDFARAPVDVARVEALAGVVPALSPGRPRGRRWQSATPRLLDREGMELVLIGVDEEVPVELGLELRPQQETLATADVLADLKLRGPAHPDRPLVRGEWA